MKLEFEDRSFVEIRNSDDPEKVLISIQAKDHFNPLKKINNTVEITIEEFKKLIADVKV